MKIPVSIKLVLISVVGFMAACTDDKNTASIVPEIAIRGEYLFNSGYGYDSFVWVDIEFKDGDDGRNHSVYHGNRRNKSFV